MIAFFGGYFMVIERCVAHRSWVVQLCTVVCMCMLVVVVATSASD